MEFLLLALVAGLGLFGTMKNKTKIETVVEYHHILVAPPEELIQNCIVVQPPIPEVYLGAPDWSAKEGILVENILESQKQAMICNTRIDGLRVWKAEQAKIYSGPAKDK